MIDTKKLGSLVLPMFLLATSAYAASLPLQWQPVTSPDVRGYRVYYGTASRTYLTSIDAGNNTQYTLSGLTACTRYYVAVKAYNQAGILSSSYSNEVVGMPTPQVTLVSPSTAEVGQSLTISVTGSSFDTGAALSLPTKLSVVSSSRISCTLMSATISVAPDAAAGTKSVSVYNTDLSQGTLASGFNVTAASAPRVNAVSPAPGSPSVATTVRPAILFSERMMASSINSTAIRLLRPDGVLMPHAAGSPLLDTTGTIAVIVPAAPLNYSTQYRINVLAGAAWGVRDAQGTPLTAAYLQSPGFQVAGVPLGQGSGPAGTTPPVTTARVTAAEEPIVDFDAPMDPESLTATTISLIGPWGPVEQTRASPAADESGLRVTISPRVSLEPGAVYRVRVMGGPHGVRDAEGQSLVTSFETEGFIASMNPTTDQTDPDRPAEGLWPVEVDPADRTADVPAFLHPAVTFNRRMDPVSLSSATVRLLDPEGLDVPQAAGSPILEATGTIATIVPAGMLLPGVAYRIEVAGGADGVRDETGATMKAHFAQRHGFAVEAAGVQRPEIESTSPAGDERRVDTNVRPTITFTVPLDPSSVDTTSIELLTANGRAVPQAEGSPFLDGSGTVVTIVPAEPLRGRTVYRVRVLTGPGSVRDFAGRSMSALISGESRFRTRAGRARRPRVNEGAGPGAGTPQP